jgi:CubicO group peptidase (beta-lactamase class C family)
MKKTLLQATVLLVTFVTFYSTIFPQNTVALKKEQKDLLAIRAKMKEEVRAGKIPSISVGVFQNGKIIWRESFGWADIENKIRATPDTIYALGSLSKSMTGTGIFKLVEQGKLSLDDPINQHLKTAQLKYRNGKAENFKIFHLLNMTAGIPHYWHYYYKDENDSIPTLKEQIEAVGFTSFKAGEVHHYSNFSFAILDQIIADVSKRPFEDFMKEEVFRPAGMKDTWFDQKNIPANADVAQKYDAVDKTVAEHTFIPRGGAGFFSTVNDLIKYGQFHLKRTPKVLNSATIDANHRVLKNLPYQYYANGWGVLETADKNVTLLSNGAIAGAATTILVIPTADVAIVCLVNMSIGNEYTDNLAFQIADALIPSYQKNIDKLIKEVTPLFEPVKFKADKSLSGSWKGFIHTKKTKIPARFRFSDAGEIYISLDKKKESKVSSPAIEEETLIGNFSSVFKADLLKNKEYSLSFKLHHEKEKLRGILFATVANEKAEFSYPFYLELKKE